MKQVKYAVTIMGVIMLWMMSMTPLSANTITTTIRGPGSITPQSTFEVVVGVSGAVTLYGFTADISFDSSKVTLLSTSTGLNGFNLTLGSSKIVLDSASGRSGTYGVVTLRFRATASFSVGESSVIRVNNVKASDGSRDLSGTSVSTTVSMSAARSSNNNLATLTLSQTSISFNPNTLTYEVEVDNEVETITISATSQDAQASISGTGEKSLAIYQNRFEVVVRADNGATKTYVVIVNRKDANGNARALSSNNNISALLINQQRVNVNPEQSVIRFEVAQDVEQLELEAVLVDDSATLSIEKPDVLVFGNNQILITITAENGDVKVVELWVFRNRVITLTLEQVASQLASINDEAIGVTLEDQVVSIELLNAFKANNKTLVVKGIDQSSNITYEWVIPTQRLDNPMAINTQLQIETSANSRIVELANYGSGLILSFGENESLPINTLIALDIGNQYPEGLTLNLYYYDPIADRLVLKASDLIIEAGRVWIPLSHTSQYFLTPTTIINQTSQSLNVWMVVAIAQTALMITMVMMIIRLKAKVKRT